jgi:hypothetical protein
MGLPLNVIPVVPPLAATLVTPLAAGTVQVGVPAPLEVSTSPMVPTALNAIALPEE